MPKRAGVIGSPVGHSISPAMFAAAFKAAGIDATYEAWETSAEVLEGRINALRSDDYLGANVTVPHKQAVIPLLDEMDPRASDAGAVNVIVHRDGKLTGYNTDASGFARSLREDAGFDGKRKKIMLLGSGGAARAVALALIEQNPEWVYVVGRTPRNIDRMVVDIKRLTPSGTTITWAYWGDGSYMRALAEADLIVNCTPIGVAGSETDGQSPLRPEEIRAGVIVYDLVYNPAETPLLAAARARGATPVRGIGMLVYQAAEAFKLWTGRDADVAVMRQAAEEALSARA